MTRSARTYPRTLAACAIVACAAVLAAVYLRSAGPDQTAPQPLLEPQSVEAAPPPAAAHPVAALPREEVTLLTEPVHKGIIRGRVTGLPAFVHFYAHPPLGIILSTKGQPDQHIPLDEKGRFAAEGLAPGRWTLTPYDDFAFRFPEWSTSLPKDGAAEVNIASVVETHHTFQLQVNQDALGFDEFVPWRLHVREPFQVAGGRNDGVADLYRQPEETLRTSVFEGEVEFHARLSLRGRTAVFPRLEATRSVVMERKSSDASATPVRLTFPSPGHLIRLTGVIAPNKYGRGYPVKLTATHRDGREVKHHLRLDSKNHFDVLVAVDRLVGPQLYVSTRDDRHVCGPVALAHGDIELGELSFVKRDTEPAPLSFDLLVR